MYILYICVKKYIYIFSIYYIQQSFFQFICRAYNIFLYIILFYLYITINNIFLIYITYYNLKLIFLTLYDNICKIYSTTIVL